MKKKIVFMGTPTFAKEILEHLLSFEELEIIGVISQPDKKMSRKKKIVYSPVKESALKYQCPLFQPRQIKDFVDEMKALNPDAIITCAYGQFLPQAILDFLVINVHASLLPQYRGGAPMQHAIINNEQETGISLMKSVLKMDAGPVYSQSRVKIDIEDTLSSLELKLIEAAKELLSKDLLAILEGKLEAQAQDEEQVSFAKTISSNDEFVDFNRDNLEVYNHLRALIEVPSGYNYINGKRIKFNQVKLGRDSIDLPSSMMLFQSPELLEITTLNGTIEILECQLEGKQRQRVEQLYNGYHHSFNNRRLNDEN